MKFHLFIIVNIIYLISSVASESIRATSSYCTQYNNTELYFDRGKLKNLMKNQYLLENFEGNILNEGARLDYYIRYFHIAKGLCYYNDEVGTKKTLESYTKVPCKEVDEQTNVEKTIYRDFVYTRTVNCYYMYREYLAEDDERNYVLVDKEDGTQERQLKIKFPCANHIANFNNVMLFFLNDNELCPFPQDKDMVSLGDEDTIINAKNEYLSTLREMYDSQDSKIECYDENNEEVINCGFNSQKLKAEYCPCGDECCSYRSKIERINLIKYKPALIAIVIGSSTSVAFLILGLFFSYGSIKDIKTKEKIEEAVYRQERMYKNKQQSRRGSGSSSEYQNSLRPPSQFNYSLPKSQISNSDNNRPIRSPQPLPASPANYSNYNSNASLLGSNNISGSCNSVNMRPRGSSLYSQSSADLSSDISVPIEVPVSPYIDRPALTKPERSSSIVDYPSERQVIDRPPRSTPVLDCPQTPSLYAPSSPYLQPGSHPPSRPSTPNVPNSIYGNSSHQGSRPTTPVHKERRPSSIIDRPPRTPELERPVTPKLELPPSSPFLLPQ